MFRVLSRLVIFIIIVVFFLCVPKLLDSYLQSHLLPQLPTIINPVGGLAKDLKVSNFSFKFPFGLALSEFSMDIVKENGKKFVFSGDELALTLVPSQGIMNGKVDLKISGTGIILHPARSDTAGFSENGVNYIQLVARKFENDFSCDLAALYEAGFSVTEFRECYQKRENDKIINLAETYYEILIGGEKRSLLLQDMKDSKITLSDNHLLEINSLFREPIDAAQKYFLEEYPLNGMSMLLIKKYAEARSREIESKNRYQGINVTLAYFYYVMSKEIGSSELDGMISAYKLTEDGSGEESLSSALLGKISFEKGINEAEFLAPTFFNKFSYRAYNIDDENKVTEVLNDESLSE